MKTLLTILLLSLSLNAQTLPPLNQHVLHAIKSMPSGGGYSTKPFAFENLKKSLAHKNQTTQLRTNPSLAKPSFCSSATYLVLLRTMQNLSTQGALKLSPENLTAYYHIHELDGTDLWGRWNANGPGTAKLFTDLKCGTNFSSLKHAQPGDFLKIWWTDQIGKYERGHSVIFLAAPIKNGQQMITYWSSNQNQGYSTITIPASKAKRLLFSRLTNHNNLTNAHKLPKTDPFLANMLHKPYTWSQVQNACNVKTNP